MLHCSMLCVMVNISFHSSLITFHELKMLQNTSCYLYCQDMSTIISQTGIRHWWWQAFLEAKAQWRHTHSGIIALHIFAPIMPLFVEFIFGGILQGWITILYVLWSYNILRAWRFKSRVCRPRDLTYIHEGCYRSINLWFRGGLFLLSLIVCEYISHKCH